MPASKKPAGKSQNKTRPTAVSAADFIAGVDNATRRADAGTLLALMEKVTGEPAVMWGPSIVGFGTRRYRYESGREGEAPVAGFSPRAANLVLYLACDFAERGEILARLGKHKTGKGCVYVTRLADVDPTVLEELVVRSVAHARAMPTATSC